MSVSSDRKRAHWTWQAERVNLTGITCDGLLADLPVRNRVMLAVFWTGDMKPDVKLISQMRHELVLCIQRS